MRRRDLLKLLAAAPLLGHLPALAGARWDRALVLVELKGGNDGLNTVVPYADPLYHRARAHLALAEDAVLRLDERFGLHPALAPFEALWKEGELAIVHGLGYPAPNHSHFRSIEIWETAADSADYLDDGWLARQLAAAGPKGFTADGLVLGRAAGPGPLAGGRALLLAGDPDDLADQARRLPGGGDAHGNAALHHLLRVREEARGAAAMLGAHAGKAEVGEFPKSGIGKQLRQVAEFLAAGVPAPVFKVTLAGFDTHQNQKNTHERLLRELGEALTALRAALIRARRWDRVLVMTYSEFGRRVAENGSGGTDHGTAAPHFLLGGAVKGGHYGEAPSLAALDDGDLRFTTDFRRLYATVAERWWGVTQAVLPGRRFEVVDCVGASR